MLKDMHEAYMHPSMQWSNLGDAQMLSTCAYDSLLDPAWELSVLASSDCGAYSLQDEQASVHKISPVPGSAICEDSSDEEYESRCTKIHAQPAKRPRQGNQSHPGHDAKFSHAPGQTASMQSAACVCDWNMCTALMAANIRKEVQEPIIN